MNLLDREELSLSKAAQYLLEECRMVLPGMQALFGFQLIAVFSQSFDQKLTRYEKNEHLFALVMVVIAIALVMTPAALHRRAGARHVTLKFIELSTQLLLWSMFPLLIGICTDVYLIARVITDSIYIAIATSSVVLVVFILLWFVIPSRFGA